MKRRSFFKSVATLLGAMLVSKPSSIAQASTAIGTPLTERGTVTVITFKWTGLHDCWEAVSYEEVPANDLEDDPLCIAEHYEAMQESHIDENNHVTVGHRLLIKRYHEIPLGIWHGNE